MDISGLNQYPGPAFLCRDDTIYLCSDSARLIPGLAPDRPVPEDLLLPDETGCWEGTAELWGSRYKFRATSTPDGTVYCLQPQGQYALSQGQLDGALYQMRRLMGEFYSHLSPCVGREVPLDRGRQEGFSKSFYEMLRLMDHLDLLRDEENGRLSPDLLTLDLGAFCLALCLDCDGLLAPTGVQVLYDGPSAGPMCRGDRELLGTALLELISNAARRCGRRGAVTLKLESRGRRALITVTDSGPAPTRREQTGAGSRGTLPRVPMPGEGAGLGLSAAEAILRSHGGSLLTDMGGSTGRVCVSLPLGIKQSLEFHSPRPRRHSGMSQILISLSDVLPGELILPDWEQ